MEKKNMVLLTIVAVATLLVAVVGATFAYFSASVGGTGNTSNNTSTVTTKIIAGVNYEGSAVYTNAAAYPGAKGVQKFVVSKPTGTIDSSASIKYRVILTPTVDSAFNSDITYSVYKTTTPATQTVTATTGTVTNTSGKYSVSDTLTVTSGFTAIKTGALTGSTALTIDNVDKTYGAFLD